MEHVVVFTGAGVSAESGIKVFRGSGGLWCDYKVEDVCTYDAWIRDRELVNRFYNQRRKELLNSKPNKAHLSLVELEKKYKVTVITQNVDDLHERAGSSNVLHLHGELRKARSLKDGYTLIDIDGWELPYEKTTEWRPHIVWFGEAVPEFENAIKIAKTADYFIVIGTSLNVYPAASLIYYIKEDIPKFLVDPHSDEQSLDRISNLTIYNENATEGVPKIVNKLLS
ncbi:MAG: SIR2 family NAD-dependent protein deacylase [Bacteroidales bacterium]|jgi:NAD-dependent deacetylase